MDDYGTDGYGPPPTPSSPSLQDFLHLLGVPVATKPRPPVSPEGGSARQFLKMSTDVGPGSVNLSDESAIQLATRYGWKPPAPQVPAGPESPSDVLLGPNRHVTWPEQAVHSAIDAVQAPAKAASGELPLWDPTTGHTSEEGVQAGLNLAGIVNPAGLATKAEGSALGSGFMKPYEGPKVSVPSVSPYDTALAKFEAADDLFSAYYTELKNKYGNIFGWEKLTPEEKTKWNSLHKDANDLAGQIPPLPSKLAELAELTKVPEEAADVNNPDYWSTKILGKIHELTDKYGDDWHLKASKPEIDELEQWYTEKDNALAQADAEHKDMGLLSNPESEPAAIGKKILDDMGVRTPGAMGKLTDYDVDWALGSGAITDEQAWTFKNWLKEQKATEPEDLSRYEASKEEQQHHSDWLMQHYKENLGKDGITSDFNTDELQALYDHRGSSMHLNESLRNSWRLDQNQTRRTEILDKLIARSAAPKEVVAYHGTSKSLVNQIRLLPAGYVWSTPSFLSATPASDVAGRFGTGTMRVIIPQGGKAIAFGKHSLSDENEILFPRNAKFQVVNPNGQYPTLKLLDKDELTASLPWDDWTKMWERAGGGFSSTIEPPKTANWTEPPRASLIGEYDREVNGHLDPETASKLGSFAQFANKVKDAPVEYISREMDQNIDYRSHTTNESQLLDLLKTYRSYPQFRNEETLKNLSNRIKNGDEVDMPIVLRWPDGRMRVLSGNTRMDLGFMHHDYVKAKVIDVK